MVSGSLSYALHTTEIDNATMHLTTILQQIINYKIIILNINTKTNTVDVSHFMYREYIFPWCENYFCVTATFFYTSSSDS